MVSGGKLRELLEALCIRGLRAVQLREKDLSEADLAALALSLRPVFERNGTRWLVNGPAAVAARCSATGVHLAADQDAEAARAVVGEGALVGKSVHDAAGARSAEAAGADLVLFGPVFDTPAKRRFGPPQGIERLREVCESIRVPVFAIGGVTPARVPECRAAGARGVAVMSALMEARGREAEVLDGYGRVLGGY